MLKKFKSSGESSTKNLLKSILDSAFNGIMTFRSVRDESEQIIDMEWLFINDVAARILGKNPEQVEGKRLLEVLPGNKDTGVFDKYKTVVETGEHITFEQYYPEEKINKWLRISAVKLSDGLTVTLQDISEMKEVGLKMESRERKYRKLFEESIDAIFLTNKDFRFLESNPAFQKMFGYAPDELAGSLLLPLFDQEKQYYLFKNALQDKAKAEEYEVVLRDKNGSKKTCLINCVSITDDRNLITYLGVIRDMTRRRQADRELMMAEKLSMTGKIARTIAHEIRNPLTNMILALEQLRDEVPDDVEDSELYFNIIRRNADRVGKLITELLDSSKPKELKLVTQSVNEQVRKVLDLVKDRLELQHMKLHEHYDPDLPQVQLDKDQFKIALLNLYINAIEAMKSDQGVLSVSTFLENGHIKVMVRDNGKGISKENLNNLFEPFFTGKKDGMGLGLTTVQNIIHSHRGQIEVESEVGKGTAFFLTIPAQA